MIIFLKITFDHMLQYFYLSASSVSNSEILQLPRIVKVLVQNVPGKHWVEHWIALLATMHHKNKEVSLCNMPFHF